MKKTYIIFTYILSIIFIYSGLVKIANYDKFFITLKKSPILIGETAHIVSIILPTTELILGLMLFFMLKKIAKYALMFSLSLLIVFTIYIIAILNYTYYIPCACGGIIEEIGWNGHLILNSFLIIINLCLIYLEKKRNLV